MADDVKSKLRDYIKEMLQTKGDAVPFGDSDSLFASGRLNSLDATEAVIFLEDNFRVDFAKIGFDQSFVDSIDAMANLVNQAKAG